MGVTVKRGRRALSFLEMVFAIAVLTLGAGGVMSTLVAGASWPRKIQQATQRDLIARTVLTQLLQNTPTPGPFPLPNHPGYTATVAVHSPAAFDSGSSIVEVTVTGPAPETTASVLKGAFTPSPGALLLDEYDCQTCHLGGLAPPLGMAQLTASRDAQNALYGTSISVAEYIEQSIREPERFVVATYNPDMSAQPNILHMPQQDLDAIRTYIMTLP